MQLRDFIDLLTLAALWGASYLFMKVAVPEFGPFAMVEMRVLAAALLFLPVLIWRRGIATVVDNWRPLLIVGAMNSAIPFCFIAYGALHVSAGFAGMVNASTPLFGAVVAAIWLRERLGLVRIVGLFVGFVGVTILVWGKLDGNFTASTTAVLAMLMAAACYGWSASYMRLKIAHLDGFTAVTGSMFGAALLFMPVAIWFWPEQAVSAKSWVAVAILGGVCTGLAYLLYFRLIARLGPIRAISVTFMVPMFALVWGRLFLGETFTVSMIAGGAIILCGTALVNFGERLLPLK
ncbi:MAG: drug/metabolite transporter (DMT)-like permease [Halieaceae bacterium]|jgi:drug/metabolite transporter (DMT)-like permease